MSLSVGKVYANYEILDFLGSGAFGEVYKVKNIVTGEIQALKLLKNSFGTGSLDQRVARELLGLREVRSQHVVQPIEITRVDGYVAMSMEFVSGQSLQTLIERKRPGLTVDLALATIRQVLAGLSVVHKAGIIHRDIKPANILITSTWDAKVADFGIAHFANMARLTSGLPGTPAYMAPDYVDPSQVEPHMDIYSAGITFYELLSGDFPLQPNGEMYYRGALVPENALPLMQAATGIPDWVGKIVDKAISRDPAVRYQNADSMLEAVERGGAVPAIVAEKRSESRWNDQWVNATLRNPSRPENSISVVMSLDTGASRTVIPESIARRIGLLDAAAERTLLMNAFGFTSHGWIAPLLVDIPAVGRQFLLSVVVLATGHHPLLGLDAMRHFRVVFDGPAGKVSISSD